MSAPPGLAVALLGSLCLSVASAQENVVTRRDGERQICTVRTQAYFGAGVVGGFGFVLVEAENLDARPHPVRVQIGGYDRGDSDMQTGRSIGLGPFEHGRFFLPVPTPQKFARLDVQIDATTDTLSIVGSHAQGVCGLFVTDRADTAPFGVEVLQALPSSIRAAPQQTLCASANLPADWRLFTGFHAVVVDGRAQVRDEVQEALRRFVFAGGTIVAAAPERLPAGALRDLCETADGRGLAAHGLGTCAVIPAFGGDTTAMRECLARLPKAGRTGWPAFEPLLREQVIPGLGRAPVIGFLFVMLAFATLVGPVNFFLLRRSRRPLLALLTVPALGIGTTLVMLGYGLVHDGFGVRGTVHSWTLLDQARHEAVTLTARTLFAGLAPGSLSMSPDVVLLAPRALQRPDRRAADRWYYDAESGSLDGGVLPSRSTTPLFSAREGMARQRLRARFVGPDELQLLGDGGVEPKGEVLLRDFDGAYWNGVAPVLRRVAEADAADAYARLRLLFGRLVVDDGGGGTEVVVLGTLVERCVGARELPVASYLAQVAKAPWNDEHGLDVAYDQALHFVAGRLDAEDLAR